MRTKSLRSLAPMVMTTALVFCALTHTDTLAGGSSSGGGDPWENEVVVDGDVSASTDSTGPVVDSQPIEAATVWVQVIAAAFASLVTR